MQLKSIKNYVQAGRGHQIAIYASKELLKLLVAEGKRRNRKLGPTAREILLEYFRDQQRKKLVDIVSDEHELVNMVTDDEARAR